MTDGTLDRLTQVSAQLSVGPDIYGTIVDLGSEEYEQFQRFQVERFARLQSQSSRAGGESDPSPTYTEATHTLPSEVVPIVVRRRHSSQTDSQTESQAEDQMLGIARLELPGATLIESMIALRPGSVAAEALAQGKAAEIGGFAALEGISRQDLISVVDAIVGVVTELARQRGLEWLWIFPRAAFMSLLRAEIADELPPYHFTVSPDIAGWLPGSSQLEAFRSMRLRGFMDIPLIYQITADMLADDLATRMARYEQRVQLGARLGSLLGRAMISAQRTLRQEIELLYPSSRQALGNESSSQAGDLGDESVSFLPSGLSNDLPLAAYLRRVLSEGGVPAQAYKELSYSMLDIAPHQRILDVGCGAGVDLPELARLAGPTSTVVGLEINANLVREARRAAAEHVDGTMANMLVFQGDAHHMTIPDGEFDRARTDRALQHFPNPKRALAEIWRVLKPGGVVTLVEPDWGAMVVAPGSAAGEGDETVNKALDWCRRHLAHPLIGRNMSGLLRAMRAGAWQSLKVVVAPFTFSDWKAMDAVLLLSHAAKALQQERPEYATEIDEWLHAVSSASEDGSFFGYIPMFYAVAVKSADR